MLTHGHSVVALDSLHPQVHPTPGRPRDLPAEVDLLAGDVTHAPDVDAALRLAEPTVLVHLAAETGTGQSLTEASRHAEVNVVGTSRLLDAFSRRGGLDHIVLASSRAVYGEGLWSGSDGPFLATPRTRRELENGQWDPVDTDGYAARALPAAAATTEPRPASIYAATKLAQEHLAAAWATGHEVPLSVLRLQNVFGPGQSPGNPYTGVLALFADTALRKETINVYEDGAILRDFVYVRDVVDALAAALARPPATSRTVDIGSGTPVLLVDVARQIAERCGAPEPVVSGQFRMGDVRAAHCDVSAAAADIGYESHWPLDRTLDPLLEWVAELASL